MKRICGISAVLLAMGTVAAAQGPIGLMVSETAGAKTRGARVLAGGVTIGDDSDFFGGRFSGAVSEDVVLFGDFGIVDSDDVDDSGPALQAGAILNIPANAAVDLAARGAFATAFLDDKDYYSVSGMLLLSKDLSSEVRGFSVYGGAGFLYWEAEYDIHGPRGITFSDDDDDMELALALGILLDVTDRMKVYMEFNHVDDSFFGGGVRFSL